MREGFVWQGGEHCPAALRLFPPRCGVVYSEYPASFPFLGTYTIFDSFTIQAHI